MLKNLIKTAIRGIKKEKGYSVINIMGLTTGISCSLFLFLYILDELCYDKFHENATNIYRVVTHVKEPDNEFTRTGVQVPLAEELVTKYPEVINAVRFFTTGRELFQRGNEPGSQLENKQFYEEDIYFADSSVFEMFTYKFITGNPVAALNEPYSIVLTQSLALKYFDDADPMGKTLIFVDRKESYKVTGIIEDLPPNTHFRFDALLSVNSLPRFRKLSNWGRIMVYTYLQLPDGYDPADFQPNLDQIITDHVKPLFDKANISLTYGLQRITDIHLYSKIQDEVEAGGDISTIYIFSAIGIFILLIACINYMNLATASSARRAKEVGIRKVMGTFRRQLIAQFLTESMILAFIALLLSLFTIGLLLPAFNQIADKHISMYALLDVRIMLITMGILLFIGIFGGSYPAFYLSGFQPAAVLKGKVSAKGGNTTIRKALVVLQFSISIFMLISTVVVYHQLNFLMKKDLGFDKEQIIRIPIDDPEMRNSLSVFKTKLMKDPSVKQVATASATPGEDIRKALVKVEDNDGTMAERGTDWYAADYDFVNALGMTMVKGRNFSREILSDTASAVLVNEAMVKRMNWEEPLGKRFEASGPPRKVIGVIKDYHQNSLYNEIEPLVVLFKKDNYYTYIKVGGNNLPSTVAAVEKTWQEVFPNRPFEYQFLDEAFDAQYDSDQRRGSIFTIFSILTILIACLGLLGLTAYTTEQRAKEIGIRKVIGSSVSAIVILITKEFILLIALAALIAFPITYYFLDAWLQEFVYRIELKNEVFTFLLSVIGAVVISLMTIGYHAIKAANINPVLLLRNE